RRARPCPARNWAAPWCATWVPPCCAWKLCQTISEQATRLPLQRRRRHTMPFTVSPSSYRGGDYLFQGISNAANSITGAIQHFRDTADQAAKADALMQYLSQQSDPVTGKPMIDPKTLQSYQNHSQRQRAYLAGGITAGMSLVPALQHYAMANQRVPYNVGGQQYNIAPSQAAQLQTQQANKVPAVPTQVGGKTINLPPSSAASAELEKQRIDLAKQPKGLTEPQQFQQQEAVRKAQDGEIKNSPEFKFQQEYKVLPHQVLQPKVVDPAQQQYNLIDTSSGQQVPVQPDYNQYGVPSVPSWLASQQKARKPPTFYWQNASDIYRQSKIERDAGGTKQT